MPKTSRSRRPCDIERVGRDPRHPCAGRRDRLAGAKLDHEMRFGKGNRAGEGKLRPRRDAMIGAGEDQRGVAIAHVPARALLRGGLGGLHEPRIARKKARRVGTILRPAAARTPAGIGETARQGEIQRRAIDAALAA